MAMRTSERPTTEERVGYLEGAYSHLPTKSDVFEVEKQLSAKIGEARDETAELRTETRTGFANTQTEFANVQIEFANVRTEMRTEFANTRTGFANTQTEFANLRTEIAASEARITKMIAESQARTMRWVISACVLAVAAVTAIDRIFG